MSLGAGLPAAVTVAGACVISPVEIWWNSAYSTYPRTSVSYSPDSRLSFFFPERDILPRSTVDSGSESNRAILLPVGLGDEFIALGDIESMDERDGVRIPEPL